MQSRRGAILPALILILLGLYFLAQNLNIDIPGLDQLWPVILIIVGLPFYFQYLRRRHDPGLVFLGTAATLSGVFSLYIVFGPGWGSMRTLWPVWPLIGGAAFFANWFVKRSDRGLLVPAVLATAVGVVGLLVNFDRLDAAIVAQLVQYWPVLLVLLGLGLLAQQLFRGRGSS